MFSFLNAKEWNVLNGKERSAQPCYLDYKLLECCKNALCTTRVRPGLGVAVEEGGRSTTGGVIANSVPVLG